MYYVYGKEKVQKPHYYCYNAKGRGDVKCTIHYTREEEINAAVLGSLRSVLQFSQKDEERFVEFCKRNAKDKHSTELKNALDEHSKLQKRLAELDVIIRNLYEDRVKGVISTEVFMKMLGDFTLEQDTANKAAETARNMIKKSEGVKLYADKFLGLVRAYTEIKELTPEIVSTFISKIYVGAKVDGERKIRIEYNFIGALNNETK
jgi:hypothetical protein